MSEYTDGYRSGVEDTLKGIISRLDAEKGKYNPDERDYWGLLLSARLVRSLLDHPQESPEVGEEKPQLPLCTRPRDTECHAHMGAHCMNGFQCRDPTPSEDCPYCHGTGYTRDGKRCHRACAPKSQDGKPHLVIDSTGYTEGLTVSQIDPDPTPSGETVMELQVLDFTDAYDLWKCTRCGYEDDYVEGRWSYCPGCGLRIKEWRR